jgi:hypothetical protein
MITDRRFRRWAVSLRCRTGTLLARATRWRRCLPSIEPALRPAKPFLTILPCWLRPRQRFILPGAAPKVSACQADAVVQWAMRVPPRPTVGASSGVARARSRTAVVPPRPASKQDGLVLRRSCLAALLAAPKAAVCPDLMRRSPVSGHVNPVNQSATAQRFLCVSQDASDVHRPSQARLADQRGLQSTPGPSH